MELFAAILSLPILCLLTLVCIPNRFANSHQKALRQIVTGIVGAEFLIALAFAVAHAAGVEITMTAADFNRYIGGSTGGNVPSLRTDVLRGNPTEIEHLNGALVRLGRQYDVPTPVNAMLTSVIQALGSD